jgi:thiol-disulfide isomerase/thioredoxin
MLLKTVRMSFLPLLVAVCISTPAETAPPRKGGPEGTGALQLGEKMPPLRLPGVDGKVHTESEYAAAKMLVVVFTCNHCPTAQAYEQRIIRLDADYRDKGVKVIAVSPNDPKAVRLDELGYSDLGDSLADMKIRAKHRGFTFPYLYDGTSQRFSRRLGVKATPQVFIFDADRRLRYTGRIDNSDVGEVTTHDARNAVDDLLAGRNVRTPSTRPFGCSTKWSAKQGSAKAADDRWAKSPVHLRDIDAAGIRQVLRDRGGNYVLVHVWSARDQAPAEALSELVKMHRIYARRPFRLLTISFDKAVDRGRALSLLKKHRVALANHFYTGRGPDELKSMLDAKWKGRIPHTVFLAPGDAGEVLYRKTGPFDPHDLRRTIADSLGRTYAPRRAPPPGRKKAPPPADTPPDVSPDQRRKIEKGP